MPKEQDSSASLLSTLNRLWFPSTALLAVIALLAAPVRACAPAPRPGAFVRVVEEAAIIIWDAERHVEHFVRRASFQGSGGDFGFLVPSPSTPRLAEARDDAFGLLEERIRPKVVESRRAGIRFVSWLNQAQTRGVPGTMKAGMAAARPVRVLSTQHVAGYDAVVLEADNPKALSAWLKAHGYASRPALEEWLAPYVAAHWKITAFKISEGDSHSGAVTTAPVRMSFTTNRPFFPYREPPDQRTGASGSGSRSLRIFLVSNERATGIMGEGSAAEQWANKTVWADRLAEQDRMAVATKCALGSSDVAALPWMTVFEDYSAPRPGIEDVYFSRSPDQSAKIPPPIVDEVDARVAVPVELVLLAAVLCIALWSLRKRSGARITQT